MYKIFNQMFKLFVMLFVLEGQKAKPPFFSIFYTLFFATSRNFWKNFFFTYIFLGEGRLLKKIYRKRNIFKIK